MPKFLMQPTIDNDAETARLGAGTGAANFLDDKEVGKFVKLVAESRYDLAAVGNPIEAKIVSVESATLDNFTIGSIQDEDRFNVTFDGLEATPGVGAVAIGDYVVVGTAVAKGTSLLGVPAKVCKATVQPGGVPASLTEAGRMAQLAVYAWRVISLGTVGTGAVGTTGVISRETV
jgi:hypothetical protein